MCGRHPYLTTCATAPGGLILPNAPDAPHARQAKHLAVRPTKDDVGLPTGGKSARWSAPHRSLNGPAEAERVAAVAASAGARPARPDGAESAAESRAEYSSLRRLAQCSTVRQLVQPRGARQLAQSPLSHFALGAACSALSKHTSCGSWCPLSAVPRAAVCYI